MNIEIGHYFIIRAQDGLQVITRAAPKIFNLNKCAIDLNQIIGKPFDSCYEVIDRHTGALQ